MPGYADIFQVSVSEIILLKSECLKDVRSENFFNPLTPTFTGRIHTLGPCASDLSW